MTTNVAVRTLCEFAARHGDLDFRYTPAPSAEEGIAGHQAIQSRRGYGYQSEYLLTGECLGLKLSGRADIYNPHRGRLEEIKTHRGDVSRIREHQRALHRAQCRAYGALLCRQDGRKSLELAVIYYDTGKDRETAVVENASADELWQELEDLCRQYRDWAQQEAHHREQRDALLSQLTFPFPDFRPRQRQLAETVYKSSVRSGTLLLEAPTGLGKTLGTLFPALKAMPTTGQDRLFYLTCRNTARQLAIDAVERLRVRQERPEQAACAIRLGRARELGHLDRMSRLRAASPDERAPWEEKLVEVSEARERLAEERAELWALSSSERDRATVQARLRERSAVRALDDAVRGLGLEPTPRTCSELRPPSEGEVILVAYPVDGTRWLFALSGAGVDFSTTGDLSSLRGLGSATRISIVETRSQAGPPLHAMPWSEYPSLLHIAPVGYSLDLPSRAPRSASARSALVVADTRADLPNAAAEAEAVVATLVDADWSVVDLRGADATHAALVERLIAEVMTRHAMGLREADLQHEGRVQRDRARPEGGRQAGLSDDRHPQVRNAQGRPADALLHVRRGRRRGGPPAIRRRARQRRARTVPPVPGRPPSPAWRSGSRRRPRDSARTGASRRGRGTVSWHA